LRLKVVYTYSNSECMFYPSPLVKVQWYLRLFRNVGHCALLHLRIAACDKHTIKASDTSSTVVLLILVNLIWHEPCAPVSILVQELRDTSKVGCY
jgi:hypothetical protein